ESGPTTTLVLDRPRSPHAVDRETAHALADACRAFEADGEARVGVLYGDGGTFCAGADLKAFAGAGPPNRLAPDGDGPMGPSRPVLEKPVIAAIAGYAVAGGLELALWCDLRVVEEDATLGVFCRRWGVPLIDGGTVRLPRLIGLSRALDLILTGRAVGADEALAMGLANRVVPRGQARAAAEALVAARAAVREAGGSPARRGAIGPAEARTAGAWPGKRGRSASPRSANNATRARCGSSDSDGAGSAGWPWSTTSASPERSAPSVSCHKQTWPGVWPGVAIGTSPAIA